MIRIQITGPKKLKQIELSRQDLLKVGAKAIELITTRVGKGLGLNDRRMKPLSKSYRKKKVALGKPGYRDLQSTGAMLNSLTVVETRNHEVTLGFTRRAENIKAIANQRRTPWFGLSRHDDQLLGSFVSRLFSNKIKALS